MKSVFLVTTFFFFILTMASSSLQAQRFNAGLMLGGVTSQVDGDTYDGYHKWGYLGGGYVTLQISPHSSFQMELEYIQKGSKRNDTSVSGGDTYLLRLHYIEIPFLYQYTFKRRFYFEAGPAADVSIGSLELKNGSVPNPTVPLRPVTLTGIFGFGAYLTNHLRINVRSNYSLISIRSKNIYSGYRRMLFEIGQYNNVLSLSLLWDFNAKEF
jgi:Outer membrane protein beta-barrel domain